MRILLDTNALMMPAQFRVDLFGELRALLGGYEPLVLEDVVHELEGLARGSGNDAAAARTGLLMADRCLTVRGRSSAPTVDERIRAYAMDEGCMVATNDRRLREHLLAAGVPVITLRNRKKLEIIRR
ncbi:type II toxin-antitoxin system VapC family toxin [Methanofollis fontis]|uniref:Nucleotide-binding protein n=1 Tax=Methanofollis fontis TaxID=2052832 RepID=A0A483CVU8_9EURY|nr:PIN domain-containing protein [Methanofollis fontis]TAJ45647.1 nucleotide-binding protein [Methanofollis fontis]